MRLQRKLKNLLMNVLKLLMKNSEVQKINWKLLKEMLD